MTAQEKEALRQLNLKIDANEQAQGVMNAFSAEYPELKNDIITTTIDETHVTISVPISIFQNHTDLVDNHLNQILLQKTDGNTLIKIAHSAGYIASDPERYEFAQSASGVNLFKVLAPVAFELAGAILTLETQSIEAEYNTIKNG